MVGNRMFRNLVSLSCLLIGGVSVWGGTASVRTHPFHRADGIDSEGMLSAFWVGSLSENAFSPDNRSDVVVLGNFAQVRLEDDYSRYYVGQYFGYETTTREAQDRGALVIRVDPDFAVVTGSQIVGFIRKRGPWVKSPEDQQETGILDALSGTLTYDSLQAERSVHYTMDGQTEGEAISGSGSMSVLSGDLISLDKWAADWQSPDYEFAAMTASREGNVYSGILRRSDFNDPSEWYDRLAMLEITDTNDSDGDDIPDLSDLGDVGLNTQGYDMGNGYFWSEDLQTPILNEKTGVWDFSTDMGWIYLPDTQPDPELFWVYSPASGLGWLWTRSDLRPEFIRASDGARIQFKTDADGVVRYLDGASGEWVVVVMENQ